MFFKRRTLLMSLAGAFALTNADDRNGSVMVQNTAARVHTYSLRAMADPIHRIGSDLWGQICSEINTPSAGWQWRRPRAYAIPKCSIVG